MTTTTYFTSAGTQSVNVPLKTEICPQCGYCSYCGRSNYQIPYIPYTPYINPSPYTPYTPYWVNPVYVISSGSGS